MKKWIWMSANSFSKEEFKPALGKIEKAGIDGVLLNGDQDHIEKALTVLPKSDLKIHAWKMTMICNDEKIQEAHPHWFTVNRLGESSLQKPPYVDYYKWLCPNHPEVEEYLLHQIESLAKISELAGLHLDYIRFPDVILPRGLQPNYDLVQDHEFPRFDFCYCEICREKYNLQTGVDPLNIEDPAASANWIQFRYDSITRLVNKLIRKIHVNDKLATAAVFPTPKLAKKLVRQEWEKWKLDAVFPMIYHTCYNEDISWIRSAVEEGIEKINEKFPIYSGLYIPDILPNELESAVQFAREGGSQGISLFEYASLKEDHWKLLNKM